MAKKKYYESENMFLKIEEPLKKYNNLYINSSSRNNFRATLSLDIDNERKRKDEKDILYKDPANGKNIVILDISFREEEKNINFQLTNKEKNKISFYKNENDITDTVRIARQYAKDNKMSLYIKENFCDIPDMAYCNYALDKETNIIYPILYDELKELLEHNIPITFQPRGRHQGYLDNTFSSTFYLPDSLKIEIDLTYNRHSFTIVMLDKCGFVSHNMSNITFSNCSDKDIEIGMPLSIESDIEELENTMNVFSLPKHDNSIKLRYSIKTDKPILFKDTNLEKRNVEIFASSFSGGFIPFTETLSDFYNNPKQLSENDKENLRKVFIFMKQNNCDIIEQSKFLLNLPPRFNPKLFNDRDKINNDIEKLIGNKIKYEIT